MPTQKDLKRLARSRMKKTGESYTTARATLIQKKTKGDRNVPDLAQLAGIKEESVRKATDRSWADWVKALDALGAEKMVHRDIASEIRNRWDISEWWIQTVTVGYERIKGLRETGQLSGGSFAANKSKTFPVPIAELYKAVAEKRQRDQWMSPADMTVRKRTPEKSMRISWGDGTQVEIYFWSKGDSKSQIQIQHRGFESKSAADEMKTFWAEQVTALGSHLKS